MATTWNIIPQQVVYSTRICLLKQSTEIRLTRCSYSSGSTIWTRPNLSLAPSMPSAHQLPTISPSKSSKSFIPQLLSHTNSTKTISNLSVQSQRHPPTHSLLLCKPQLLPLEMTTISSTLKLPLSMLATFSTTKEFSSSFTSLPSSMSSSS